MWQILSLGYNIFDTISFSNSAGTLSVLISRLLSQYYGRLLLWRNGQDLNLHTDYSITDGLANRYLTIRFTVPYLFNRVITLLERFFRFMVFV